MALRFLAGVALVAGTATYLVKRRRRLESAETSTADNGVDQPFVNRRPPPASATEAATPTALTSGSPAPL